MILWVEIYPSIDVVHNFSLGFQWVKNGLFGTLIAVSLEEAVGKVIAIRHRRGSDDAKIATYMLRMILISVCLAPLLFASSGAMPQDIDEEPPPGLLHPAEGPEDTPRPPDLPLDEPWPPAPPSASFHTLSNEPQQDPQESEELPEHIWEEETPPTVETPSPTEKTSTEGLKEAEKGGRKISIDTIVVITYNNLNPLDSYTVKYHLNMGGYIIQATGLIKGNVNVATDVRGSLARSPAFECLLKISIADVPYEIMFNKTDETEANINVSFKGQVLEDWDSLCTFVDGSDAKFNTRGSPEHWLAAALKKAEPPLNKLSAKLDPAKETTMKFTVPKYTVEDTGMGTVDVEGTGVITIVPLKPPESAADKNHQK